MKLNLTKNLEIDVSKYIDSSQELGSVEIDAQLPPQQFANSPFTMTTTELGTVLVPKNDVARFDDKTYLGVGYELLQTGTYQPEEQLINIALLAARQARVAVDLGANIGIMSLSWAQRFPHLQIHAVEAQRRIFYALCANIALNGTKNIYAHNIAIGAQSCLIKCVEPDYTVAQNFGGLNLQTSPEGNLLQQRALDDMTFDVLDFLKIDIEGHELEALQGAEKTILRSKPIIVVEAINVSQTQLADKLQSWGYDIWRNGLNYIAVHQLDPTREKIEK